MGDGQTLSRRALVGAAIAVVMLLLPSMAWGQTPPPADRFQKVVLDDTPGEPMNLAVLPDLRVLHTTRAGELRIYNPRTGLNTLAAKFDVYKHDEEGLQSAAVDPNFEDNHWVYAYYSPPLNTPVDDPSTPVTNEGDAPVHRHTGATSRRSRASCRLSRFKLVRSKLDMSSEQKIIEVPVDRGICCHVGGNIDFDSQGNLYLSTGDDTNPFFSDGYAPIDDSPGRNPAFDSRRGAGNTNDLRGKLLRIRVEVRRRLLRSRRATCSGRAGEDAARDLRDGTAQPVPLRHQPEERRCLPRRLFAGRQTAKPERGPAGQGRWMIDRASRSTTAGRTAPTPDQPYIDYDFATETSGEPFNCSAPMNDSRNNTGLRKLPQVASPTSGTRTASRRCSRSWARGGIGPMGGPAYAVRPRTARAFRWPRVLRRRAAVLRVDARLRQGVPAQPAQRQPARRDPRRARARRSGRQPDGHGVRPGRRALRPGVRRRVLRREPGGGARADRLRAWRPTRRSSRRRRRRARGRRAVDGRRSPARARRCGRRPARATRGTSTPTGRWTPRRPTRRTPTRRTASSTPRCG